MLQTGRGSLPGAAPHTRRGSIGVRDRVIFWSVGMFMTVFALTLMLGQ
jgi:hypothetical protein